MRIGVEFLIGRGEPEPAIRVKGLFGQTGEQFFEQTPPIDALLLEAVLVNEDNFNGALKAGSEAIEMGITVFGEVLPPNDGTVPALAIIDVPFDPQAPPVVENGLAKDGDATLKGNHKRDYRPYRHHLSVNL